jgi:capsular polysaccharide biosynthesis protein
VQVLQLHDMTMREQILVIREAHVLVGMHGAGLTHLLFLGKDTHVVEMVRPNKGTHFVELCKWKERVQHHMLPQVGFKIDAKYALHVLLPALSLIFKKRDII